MIPKVDFTTVRFEDPQFLWLLLAPALLLVLWFWQAARRRGDAHRYAHRRTLPVRQRFGLFGGLLFWLCLILATASAILALARPHARISLVRTAGIDLVILQDGSTSMRVTDVTGNRWQRSMRFLRQLGEAISWKDDRLAMALFARIATPQVRLTKDPNTYFFFLDHLSEESPFRLEDDTSWDTNMELGIYWGLKLIDKDEEIHGKSPNAKAFVLISDGQSWSGEVEKSLERVKAEGDSDIRDRRRHQRRRRHSESAAQSRGRSAAADRLFGARSRVAQRHRHGRRRAATSSWIANPTARSPTRSSTARDAGPGFKASKRRPSRSTGGCCSSRPV